MINKINNVIICTLVVYSIFCALSIGISWDEYAHLSRGNERLKYLFSFGSYDYLDYRDQRFYPGFYNTLVTFVTKMFPQKYEIETLHLTNWLFSIFTIIGISKISSELFNKNVGKIVFILCFLNPIFFGHMAINQKDMIVAFSNIWSTYLILRYLKNQHIGDKRNSYVILLGLTIGLGLGIRIVFVSILLPIIVISILDILFFKNITSKNFSYKKLIFDVIKVLIISYIIMVSCWPDTHRNIFILPFQLFFESLNNPFGTSVGLLNGDFYNTSETPKSYLLINLLYKLPEFILLCYLFFIFMIFKNISFFKLKFEFFNLKVAILLFIIVFPNLLLLINPYRIFDGLRLFLYLIPYICIIPGLVIYFLIINYKNHIHRILLMTVFPAFLYYLVIFFSLTPYHYTYLNILNGDYSKAHEKFENDYWTVSLKELAKKIEKNRNLLKEPDLSVKVIKVAFCGVAYSNIKPYLKKIPGIKFKKVDYLYEDYDYIIMTNRTIENSYVNNLTKVETCFDKFKGEDVITVSRRGLVLSTLRKKI